MAEIDALASEGIEAGCDEVGLADPTGYANPAQIRCVFRKVRAIVAGDPPEEPLYGYVAAAGVTRGFVPAAARSV